MPEASEVAQTAQSVQLATKVRAIAEAVLAYDVDLFEKCMWRLLHSSSIPAAIHVARVLPCISYRAVKRKAERKDVDWMQKILHTGTQADKRAALQLRIQVTLLYTCGAVSMDWSLSGVMVPQACHMYI